MSHNLRRRTLTKIGEKKKQNREKAGYKTERMVAEKNGKGDSDNDKG